MGKCETFEDVKKASLILYEYCKQQQEKEKGEKKIKEDSEIKKSSLIKKINNEISEAEGEIKEKKETALAEISSISESLAIEMLESLSVGEIDKGKIAALSKTDN